MKISTLVLIPLFIFTIQKPNANIINVRGNDFLDLGKSTVDLSTGLEWLDVTETVNRSFCDLYADIRDEAPTSGCTTSNNTFAKTDGWRYASQQDFRLLISNFFNVSYGGSFSSTFDSFVNIPFIEQFISLFGDTLASAYASYASPGRRTNSEGSGYIRAILSDDYPHSTGSKRAGEVEDFEVANISNGELLFDYNDQITDTNGYGIDQAGFHLGHWLIREDRSNAAAVPEPMTISLLGFLLLAVSIRRQRSIV